ncbi:major facilitator superfamily transporter [Colletotrichum musicola]|uniref:Major facilitator superfamily transporter n=1 Tax=Colletotrichum musicola TaxID=2175873 RepID=A0A8H6NAL8_9PEZI|nr:major facilitator superfamily transporter [Colletotrichum musicola]
MDSGKDKTQPRPSWFRVVWPPSTPRPELVEHRFDGSGTVDDPFIVTWLERDPQDPLQFPTWVKWCIAQILAFSFFCASFLSSAYSAAVGEVRTEFGGGSSVNSLGVGLFVAGFAAGPFIWAPMSVSQDLATILVMRFLAGTFGASPITNSGGGIADMFSAKDRGLAMTIFSAVPFLGPVLGPIIGGFVTAGAGWRWLMALLAIMTGVSFILGAAFVPETYAPVILRRRAETLSKHTRKVYRTKSDAFGSRESASTLFFRALSMPWKLLGEPIVLLLSIYLATVFATLYLLFAAYPIVYQEARGWGLGASGLPFLGIMVGILTALAYSAADNLRYQKVLRRNAPGQTPPEARLMPCMVGSVFIPAGMFWFAWTNAPSVHWMASIAAGAFFGFGLVLVFFGVTTYLVDSYTVYAASVLAGSAVLRAVFAAVFPLFTGIMYKNLGLHWASSVPGFLALAWVPFPFVLYKYGHLIRTRSRSVLPKSPISSLSSMSSQVIAVSKPALREPWQVISPSSDASLALPRILCLHGGGTNARIFKAQCRVIRAALAKDFRLVFVEAPYASIPGPDVTSVYGDWGPFKSWIPAGDVGTAGHSETVDRALRQAVDADDALGATGEWIAVLGFSQGAKLAASLLLRQQQQQHQQQGWMSEPMWSGETPAVPSFSFGVIMAGRAGLLDLGPGPWPAPARGQGGVLPMPTLKQQQRLDVASIHVHGLQDPGLELHRDMLNDFRDPVLVEWDGGHRLPIKTLHVGKVVDSIRQVARQFQ